MVQHSSINHAGLTGVGVATDTIWDAKGDLAVGSNADHASRLAVGSNSTVLMADSSQALGVKWALPFTGVRRNSAAPVYNRHTINLIEGSNVTLTVADDSGNDEVDVTITASSGGGTTELLGLTAYAPGSDSSIKAVSNTSDADVDGNLTCTFTAPASGNVLVKLSALMNDGGGAQTMHWTVRESTTTKGDCFVQANLNQAGRRQAEFYITGVSGGSHTYKFGAYMTAGTGNIYGGPTFGQAIIEIWSCP